MRESRPSEERPFVGLAFLLIVMGYAFLEGTVMAIELPDIVRDLGISMEIGNLSMTLLIATSAAALVAVGRLADQYGRRRLTLWGVALAAVASTAMACSWNTASLLLARIAQGVATAMILTSLAVLKDMFQGEQRSRAFALFGSSMGLGLALAPLVGAAALAVGTWRAAFWVNLPLLAISYWGIRRWVPESRATSGPVQIDWLGTVLLGGALLTLLSGISEGSSLGWWSPEPGNLATVIGSPVSIVPALLALAVVLLLAFWRVERSRSRRGDSILMDAALLGVPSFRLGCGVSFLFVLGGYSLQFVVPICGVYILQASPGETGILTACIGLGIAAGGYASVPLGRQVHPRTIVVSGLVLMAVGILGLGVTLGETGAIASFSSALFGIGIGYGLTYSRITEITLVGVSSDHVGLATGMLVGARTCAMALGGAILTAMVVSSIGQRETTADQVLQVRYALAFCVASLVLAIALASRLERGFVSSVPTSPTGTPERSAA